MPDTAPLSVRLADVQDAEAIVALVAALAADLQERSPVTPAYVAAYLRSPGTHVLLAVRGESVLGLASFTFRPNLYHAADSCLIDELVVERGARNQGVGALLLEEVVRRSQHHACAEISLSVMNSNRNALRFYRRHGFEDQALLLERHLHPESG
jgi:ribosomal protein S18 acetylase RimI-like enzyme